MHQAAGRVRLGSSTFRSNFLLWSEPNPAPGRLIDLERFNGKNDFRKSTLKSVSSGAFRD
jgi:hypothetical protein